MASGTSAVDAIRSLVNARDLQLECARVERMERDKIAKRVYVRKCAGSHSVGKPRRKWIDTVKEYLK